MAGIESKTGTSAVVWAVLFGLFSPPASAEAERPPGQLVHGLSVQPDEGGASRSEPEPTEGAQAPKNAKKTKKKDKDKDKKKDRLDMQARVITGWEYEREPGLGEPSPGVVPDDDEFGFFLRQARLFARLRLNKRLRLKISAEFADAFDQPQRLRFLRDAFVEFKFSSKLRLRAGRFKRPMSRRAIKSVWKVPLRTRGAFHRAYFRNDSASNAWAMRGLGLLAFGKFKYGQQDGGLRWAVSVTDPTGERDFLDVHARLRVDLPKYVDVGVSGAYRRRGFDKQLSGVNSFAFGSDVRLKLGGFRFDIEAHAVQDNSDAELDWAVGSIAVVSYKVDVNTEWALRPVFSFEFVDDNLRHTRSELYAGSLGLAVYWGEHLVLIPEARIDRSTAKKPSHSRWRSGERYSLSLRFRL